MDYENRGAEVVSDAIRDDVTTAAIGAADGANLIGASYLVGSAVQNHKGENLGEVKEVMLDAYSGRVSYAVLSFSGGVLGMRKKLFAVP